jgi:surfactin synthase thioesterase subunit
VAAAGDLDAAEVDFQGGKAHRGFAQAAAATLESTQAALLEALEDPRHTGYEVVVTGHSLGGRLSISQHGSRACLDKIIV